MSEMHHTFSPKFSVLLHAKEHTHTHTQRERERERERDYVQCHGKVRIGAVAACNKRIKVCLCEMMSFNLFNIILSNHNDKTVIHTCFQ